MEIDVVVDSDKAMLRLSGRFDYTSHASFLAQAEGSLVHPACREFWVDLAGVEYIDSSALGMLLMLRDRVRKEGKTMALANVRGYVREVIDNAQFNRLFELR